MSRSDKPPLSSLISTHDFEAAASHTLTSKAWAFISSAATDLHTLRRNSSAFSDITLRPRTLRNVSHIDTTTSMLGHKLRVPIFCSPAALAKLVHPAGETAIGTACKEAGIAQCVSTSSSYPLGHIVAAIDGHAVETPHEVPVFFQLYVDKNRENTRKLVRAAQQAGAKALFLTIDLPVPGKREADERVVGDAAISSPLSGATAGNDAKGGSLGRTMGRFIDDSLSWADIPWIRRCAPGMPLVLKGVQTSEDAELAIEAGVDAIVVSNHGGRTLDTVPASILILLELRRNCPEVFDKMEVYVDSGFRRGTDIFKALCLGAKAVGIGRGPLYAVNYGHEGVLKYIEILRDELEATMKLCGVTSLDQLHPGYLSTLAVDHLIPSRPGKSPPGRVGSHL
ncbi:Cytochrome b2 [Tolypocladium paradoxum]|uniref:L-lactate dehydrogenase (cytochrome) n=1 Tax=Tolypocladium paradoxum TaxID=94208 RepID=A0A2S4KUW3_9HYPO|nr:Cytochrome b2 [Tolypocladium paradoxum]